MLILTDLEYQFLNLYSENEQEIEFVALHIRRGDYINYRASKFHGNLDISYYLKGINFLRSKFGKIIRIETTIPTRPKALLYRDAMRFAA